MSPTKALIEDELRDYHQKCDEMRHFLIPEVIQILEYPYAPGASGKAMIARLQTWRDEVISTAEDRAGVPQHAIALTSREPRKVGGVTAPEFQYRREDGKPLAYGVRTNCGRCGELVYLLSVQKRHGGYFTAKADSDSFAHRCNGGG